MKVRLKPIEEQVMVITGASSGIGLCTARAAADAGAKVMLVARNRDAIDRIATEIEAAGGEAMSHAADVADLMALEGAAERACERWGRIDTWVNNAGVSLYGTVMDTTLDDHRRLFETNYWGVVHGSRIAVHRMRERGGALINLGSVGSDRALMLQGAYSATKHAVKGFTEALRMELEAEDVPIAVTLIKPGGIGTPYHEHARNYLDHAPRNPPPVYAPDLVAQAILYAAGKQTRQLYVGTGGRVLAALGNRAPRTTDLLMEKTMGTLQQRSELATDGKGGTLYSPGEGGRERGEYPEPLLERSVYDRAVQHPIGSLALGAAAVLGVAMIAKVF